MRDIRMVIRWNWECVRNKRIMEKSTIYEEHRNQVANQQQQQQRKELKRFSCDLGFFPTLFPFSHAYNVDGFLSVNHFFHALTRYRFSVTAYSILCWLCICYTHIACICCVVLCCTVVILLLSLLVSMQNVFGKSFCSFFLVSNTLTHSTIYIRI